MLPCLVLLCLCPANHVTSDITAVPYTESGYYAPPRLHPFGAPALRASHALREREDELYLRLFRP